MTSKNYVGYLSLYVQIEFQTGEITTGMFETNTSMNLDFSKDMNRIISHICTMINYYCQSDYKVNVASIRFISAEEYDKINSDYIDNNDDVITITKKTYDSELPKEAMGVLTISLPKSLINKHKTNTLDKEVLQVAPQIINKYSVKKLLDTDNYEMYTCAHNTIYDAVNLLYAIRKEYIHQNIDNSQSIQGRVPKKKLLVEDYGYDVMIPNSKLDDDEFHIIKTAQVRQPKQDYIYSALFNSEQETLIHNVMGDICIVCSPFDIHEILKKIKNTTISFIIPISENKNANTTNNE